MHAASEDLRICRFQTGKVPRRVYDVQIAAGLVGFGYPLSLGNLVARRRCGSPSPGRDADRLAATAAVGRAAPLCAGRRALPSRTGRFVVGPADRVGPHGLGRDRVRATSSVRSRTGSRRSSNGVFRGCISSAGADLEIAAPAGRVALRGGAASEPAGAAGSPRRPARGDRQTPARDAPRPGGPARLQPTAPARQERRDPRCDRRCTEARPHPISCPNPPIVTRKGRGRRWS